MNQTSKNDKKLDFEFDFILWVLSLLVIRHWPKSGLQNYFSWILPLVDVINCCKLSRYPILRKTN